MGGSGIAGDVATAVAGRTCPVPVVVHRGYRLPGWVGPMDLVVAVSCSGGTEETLSATDEALRRGAQVVTVGAAGSPLAARSDGGRALHLRVDARGRMPRANLWAWPSRSSWSWTRRAGRRPAGSAGPDCRRLDRLAEHCAPAVDSLENPAKAIAAAAGRDAALIVWGETRLASVAAARIAASSAENAK